MANDKDKGNGAGSSKFKVTISVNGQNVKEKDYPEDEKIEVAVHAALVSTMNKDDLALYDITNEGNPVDVSKTWAQSGIAEKSTVIVSNKPGKKA